MRMFAFVVALAAISLQVISINNAHLQRARELLTEVHTYNNLEQNSEELELFKTAQFSHLRKVENSIYG